MSVNWKNQLYFGDNLDVLQQLYASYPQGFIDLIYIDPPFNSKRNYNVLFESVDMKDSTAQKEAFADTWSNVSYIMTLSQLADLDINLYNFIKNLDNTNISKGAIAYLTTMAVRLWYMHKLLKPTGSFYLHCDPTMSHYLKILCDLIFGEKNFRNEIIWCYTGPAKVTTYFPRKHDIIFYYAKSSNNRKMNFDDIRVPYSKESLARANRNVIKKGGTIYDHVELNASGKIPEDWWSDLVPASRKPGEHLGYPTQKPEGLMERIIKASSNEGELIADFFCGCGTTIAVAERLKRKWIGVDISHLAVKLIGKRLTDTYGDDILKTFEIHGFPKDIDSARELANNVKGGRLEFEEWIVEVLLHGVINERRNEMGFDGYRTFSIYDKKYIVMIEVKSGGASPTQLNHFIKTVEDKKGSIGLFICFANEITKNMEIIAKKEGQFTDDFDNTYCDKIQLISVEELMEGKRPAIPLSKVETFKKAEKVSVVEDTQAKLDL